MMMEREFFTAISALATFLSQKRMAYSATGIFRDLFGLKSPKVHDVGLEQYVIAL